MKRLSFRCKLLPKYNISNWKMWQLRCVATWGRPKPRQSLSALISLWHRCRQQVWSRPTYPLPFYSIILLIRYDTLWPWPLTLRLWPFTLTLNVIYWLYQIWAPSSGGVIGISIFDLMTLNTCHVLSSALE